MFRSVRRLLPVLSAASLLSTGICLATLATPASAQAPTLPRTGLGAVLPSYLGTYFGKHDPALLRAPAPASVNSFKRVSVAHGVPSITLNVCVTGCPFSQIAPAIAAASDGDTIRIGPGTYAGGLTIDVSVALVGSGAHSTIISGGGPVLTIGTPLATSEPAVSISGLTIENGVTVATPLSVAAVGVQGAFVGGGGIEIPPDAQFSGGAQVTISNSVITSNVVDPTMSVDSGLRCPSDITISCINGDLPFAQGTGGGIDNWGGTLTLSNSEVTNNIVGAPSGLANVASDASGGGIQSWLGAVTVSNTIISGNEAEASAPNGRNVGSGAIGLAGGTLSMTNSVVTHNAATLNASMPSDVPDGSTGADAGGMDLQAGVTVATISSTTVADNALVMSNSVGDSSATSGGVLLDGSTTTFALSNSVISDNSVYAATLPGSIGSAFANSGGAGVAGSITNTRMSGNLVTAFSAAGDAGAVGGAVAGFYGQISNSVFSQNVVRASSPQGNSEVGGGGLDIGYPGATLQDTAVSGNTVVTSGQSELAGGGGLLDAPIAGSAGPLALVVLSTHVGDVRGDPRMS